MTKDKNDEPVIEVTATTVGGRSSTQHFDFKESSGQIAGATLPNHQAIHSRPV